MIQSGPVQSEWITRTWISDPVREVEKQPFKASYILSAARTWASGRYII